MPPLELRRNEGSCTPCAGRTTSPPSSASLILRLPALSCTAFRICALARRMKRWRFARVLPLGFRRRSTMCIVCLSDLSGDRRACSSRLFHTHIPLHEPPDLSFGVAAGGHAVDELGVFLFGIAVLLRAKADDGQQFLHLAEHTPFN